MQNTNEDFRTNKTKAQKPAGFVPQIIESVGYGVKTAIDPVSRRTGLVPIPTEADRGATGQERTVDNPECYAKAVKFAGEPDFVYYLRRNVRGDLADPWGLNADAAQNARVSRHTGKAQWEFRRVNEQTFLIYLKYLANRSNSLLRLCERAVKDA